MPTEMWALAALAIVVAGLVVDQARGRWRWSWRKAPKAARYLSSVHTDSEPQQEWLVRNLLIYCLQQNDGWLRVPDWLLTRAYDEWRIDIYVEPANKSLLALLKPRSAKATKTSHG